MSTLVRNTFQRGRFNNYLVGGNVCNAFALGTLAAADDFFLIGAEPTDDSSYPMLTGNILDSEGNLLFRLVRNILVLNPGHCSKLLGNHIGYEIHDGNGKEIFKIQTVYEALPGETSESYVTTISANFYDKNKRLVFHATSGGSDERIETSVKSVFGFSGGGFGLVQGMDQSELDVARLMLRSGGAIHRVLTGPIAKQDVSLDGTALFNAQVSHCKVTLSTGDFAVFGTSNSFSHCTFEFFGAAANIRDLVLKLAQSK